MMSPRDKFTSLKDMVGNKPIFSRERVAEMERHVRCIIPPRVFPGQRWHVVQHKNFPQRFSKTQKRRMQRQRLANRRQNIDVPDKTLLYKAMELEKVKEGMVPSLEKTKFGRKATEDMESMSSVDEVMELKALLIGEILISLNCSTVTLTLLTIFNSKKAKEDLVEAKGKHLATEEDEDHSGITIESYEECRTHKVILKKPFVEMTRYIKPLYVRAHLKGRPVSKVLIDNESVVNVMPLRMLRALGMNFSDMIEIEVVVSAFTGEVSKLLGILPIDITISGKKFIICLLCDRLHCKLQHFSREGLDSCQLVCVVLSSTVLIVLER